MTHIAHVLSSFGMGGQERVAYDLAVSQVQAGYRVTAVSLAAPPDGPLAAELEAAGVGVARIARSEPGVELRLIARLARWCVDEHVDLVHTHNRMALIYGAPAGRIARAAVVHTKHGKNPRGGTRLIAGNIAGRMVHAFVAVSEETAKVARRRHEVSERRLLVIDNGISLAKFHPDAAARTQIRNELGISETAIVIGTVGRVAAEKNHALLWRAAAPLLSKDVHLVIAGDGPLLAELRTQATSPFAHLLGMRKDAPAVLNALDIFAMSSETEGLPLVIPEAMATGLPIVSTNVGGIPNVIDEGQTGFLVDRGDEAALRDRLSRLLSDATLRRACGERARNAAVTRFSAERMQREYLDLYTRVLKRKAS